MFILCTWSLFKAIKIAKKTNKFDVHDPIPKLLHVIFFIEMTMSKCHFDIHLINL
jgi:hypothetical protein